MMFDDWEVVAMFCPNCGKKVMGYKNSKGGCKMECGRCHAVLYSVQKKSVPTQFEIKMDMKKQVTTEY